MPKGRPTGTKKEVNYPVIGIENASAFIKKAYEGGGDSIMTFGEICKYMDIKGGSRSPYIASMALYGLVEKTGLGWHITELGKEVAIGDASAIREAFFKIKINQAIYTNFPSPPSIDMLILFLKRQLKSSAATIAKRFLEGAEFLNKLDYRGGEKEFGALDAKKWVNIMHLAYALNPPEERDIVKMAEEVADDLEKEDDIALKTLSKSIRENSKNKQILNVLLTDAIEILSHKYPQLFSSKLKNEPSDIEDSEEN